MTTLPESRVQVVNVPQIAPGVCLLCGTAGIDDRTFVDFGKQVDWYGAVYLCSECIKEVAIAVGFIPVADFDRLHEAYRECEVAKELANAKYAGVVSALDQLFANYSGSSVTTSNFLGSPLDTQNTVVGLPVFDEVTDNGESKTDEPIVSEGPDDLFDATDFDD